MTTAPAQTEVMSPPVRLHLVSPVGGQDEKVTKHLQQNPVRFLKQYGFQDELPAEGADTYACELEVAPGVVLSAASWGSHVFIFSDQDSIQAWRLGRGKRVNVDEPFFSARIIKGAFTKEVKKTRRVRKRNRWGGGWENEEYVETDTYEGMPRRTPSTEKIPYAYFHIEVSAKGSDPVVGEFKFWQPDTGKAVLVPGSSDGEVRVTSEFFGLTRSWVEHLSPKTLMVKSEYMGGIIGSHQEGRKNQPLGVLCSHLASSDCPDGADAWWGEFLKHQSVPEDKLDTRGIKALLGQKKYRPVLEKLELVSPVNFAFFRWLFSGRTSNKININKLLSAMLRHLGPDFHALNKALTKAREYALKLSQDGTYSNSYLQSRSYYYTEPEPYLAFRQDIAKSLPGSKEVIQEREAKDDWSKRKTIVSQADGLGITTDVAPRLRKAIEKRSIPTAIFNQPTNGGAVQPVNREYALWEKALARKGWSEPLSEIAKNAAGRKTYERDITPYLAFLFRIEKYLDRHTEGRKKWRAVPKFVSSQWELEMEDQEGATTKRRSAFTPVADNETRTVTVPYVAVAVSGVRTQWCYSRHYYVFEDGMIDPESGGVVVDELETGLNGRDDYGLMYFTLTGTITARGYPTFLVIFERLSSGTRVHFHRVLPKRSIKGVKTPACQLIQKCYAYMAGNVPAEDVAAQQGDLIFIRHPGDPIEAGAKVAKPQESPEGLTFESHSMIPLWEGTGDKRPSFKLFVSEAKTPRNRLGFLWAPGSFTVRHPEHEDIDHMDEGWWEVRRCRSWEANPKSIWSLTID